ncbi:hypothetical protein LCGC14_2240900 [marine sediment metagenome]|uniref:Uncharacterized protein n=1 Tax=marine sediment metagenome TaxID=412755 RepID=A0A0F9DT17_9ZZZZ
MDLHLTAFNPEKEICFLICDYGPTLATRSPAKALRWISKWGPSHVGIHRLTLLGRKKAPMRWVLSTFKRMGLLELRATVEKQEEERRIRTKLKVRDTIFLPTNRYPAKKEVRGAT